MSAPPAAGSEKVTYGKIDAVDLSVVITLFNEEGNVEPLTRNLIAAFREALGGVKFELILVLNGPGDRTPAIAERLYEEFPEITLVHVHPNRGYGGGILAGLRYARAPVIGYLDGDEQVDSAEAAYIFTEAMAGAADLCKATRVAREDGFKRRAISVVFNLLFRILYGGRAQDINAKPKVFKKEALENLKLTACDWFLDAEIMIQAHRLGFKIHEIPVTFRRRKSGESNVRMQTLVEFLKNMWKYRNAQN